PTVSNGSPTPVLARLVTGQPDVELPCQEMRERSGVACLMVILLQRERPVKTLQGFMEALQFVQRDAAIAVGVRIIRAQCDSNIITRDGILEALEFLKRIGSIVMQPCATGQ